MRIALLPDGRPIGIETYKARPAGARPTDLRCAAATTSGDPCHGKAWPMNLDSKVRAPWFAARHVPDCTAHVEHTPSETGDAGHTVTVVRRDILRITRGHARHQGTGARHDPDDTVAGPRTQRSVPAGPGEHGRSVDSAPRLLTLLGDLITAGVPDTLIECPITGRQHPAQEYILPLATARGATGWHILFGQIYTTGIRPESRSRFFDVRRGTRGTAHQALRVYISPHMLDEVLGRIPIDNLVGRWIILLSNVKPGRSWCEPLEAFDVAIRRAPA